ncbi:MAG TPA: pitrilysin family protein [Bryobacteraceae bacterium]|jgi:zinc protease|nr:pitrilysin family protein [Bryobacteraceae bacterium]
MRNNPVRWSLALISTFTISFAQIPVDPGSKAIPLSQVERKNKAPVSDEILRVKIPKPTEITLPNGLTVMVLEDHRLPLVTARLSILGAGALNDPADVPGLANITATMLKEGTRTRSSKQIAEQTEELGAMIGAQAPFASETATFTASGLSDNASQWIALASDILLNPSFPEDELNKLKQRTKIQLQQQRSTAGFLMQERFSRAVYGNHPAAVTSPTLAALDKITPAMLAEWHATRYVPENAILGVAGDITPAQVTQMFSALPAWKAGSSKVALPKATKPASGRQIFLVDRPGSVQTDVEIGNIAINRMDADYVPMVVMDRIVGGGASARLFMNLREVHGYTYGAYSALVARRYAGPWIAEGSMRTDATGGAMTEFMNEINRIRDKPVPEKELEETKRSIVASFALTLERPTELLDYAIALKVYNLPADYWDTYPAKIMAITAEQVQRVARKYIVPDDLQIVAVGDAAKLKPVLDKYGSVQVFDTNGQPKATP